jgi:diguanylate cyclase (GGDEF)-like protein
VAKLFEGEVRETDIVVHYGGDEFLLILPDTNGKTNAVVVRIHQSLARSNKENLLVDFPVTLAIGAAHWHPGTKDSVEKVLRKADQRMSQHTKRSTLN